MHHYRWNSEVTSIMLGLWLCSDITADHDPHRELDLLQKLWYQQGYNSNQWITSVPVAWAQAGKTNKKLHNESASRPAPKQVWRPHILRYCWTERPAAIVRKSEASSCSWSESLSMTGGSLYRSNRSLLQSHTQVTLVLNQYGTLLIRWGVIQSSVSSAWVWAVGSVSNMDLQWPDWSWPRWASMETTWYSFQMTWQVITCNKEYFTAGVEIHGQVTFEDRAISCRNKAVNLKAKHGCSLEQCNLSSMLITPVKDHLLKFNVVIVQMCRVKLQNHWGSVIIIFVMRVSQIADLDTHSPSHVEPFKLNTP